MQGRHIIPALIAGALVLASVWEWSVAASLVPGSMSQASAAAQRDQNEKKNEMRRRQMIAALDTALLTNMDYCQQWLDADDFASLSETTHGVMLLTELLDAESDSEVWQRQIDRLQASVSALQQAAGEKDKDDCRHGIQAIRESVGKLERLDFELAAKPTYQRGNDIARTMNLLDATYADARRALLFDEVANAQREALVLWCLGEYLKSQNARGTSSSRWQELADAYSQAILKVVDLAEPDKQSVSSALTLAREECENCHSR